MDPARARQSSEEAAIVLASASPRRRELLRLAGVPHRVLPSRIEEQEVAGEDPRDHARRVAAQKAAEVVRRCAPGSWVLAADTVVVIDGQLLGKPRDLAHGQQMLELLSGRTHRVLTAVHLVRAGAARAEELLERTEVTFRLLPPAWIEGYLATGEPMDKAGAYGIQGLGALLVRSIQGSYTNVVGLPLGETVDLLERAGVFRPFAGGSR